MRTRVLIVLIAFGLAARVSAQQPVTLSFGTDRSLSWPNAYSNAVASIERLTDVDPLARAEAAATLGEVLTGVSDQAIVSRGTDGLVRLLEDAQPQVRYAAASSLEKLTGRNAEGTMLDMIQNVFEEMLLEGDATASAHAERSLARIANSNPNRGARVRAFEFLISNSHSTNATVRARAVRAFYGGGWYGAGDVGPVWVEERVVPALLDALRDPSREVRRAAVRSLDGQSMRVRNRDMLTPAIPHLLDQFEDDAAEHRKQAVWLVARIAYPSQDEAILSSVVTSLLAALNDPSAEVRQGAASGLGNLAASRVASDLLRPTVPALTRGLQDPDERVRRYAATALGGQERNVSSGLLQKINDDALIASVMEALGALDKDPDPEVQARAVEAIARLARHTADPESMADSIGTLQSVLTQGGGGARGGADALVSLAFAMQDDPSQQPAAKALATALDEGDAEVRQAIIESLRKDRDRVQGHSAWSVLMPGVIDALQGSDMQLRASAAELLYTRGFEIKTPAIQASAVNALAEALLDFPYPRRWRAAEALGRLADGVQDPETWESVSSSLREALQADDTQVRAQAARAFQYVAQHLPEDVDLDPVVQALTNAMAEGDLYLAGHAAAALGAIYCERGQIERAIEAYRKATDVQTRRQFGLDAGRSVRTLGDLYAESGRYLEAIETYEKAIETDPLNKQYYRRRIAELHAKAGRAEEIEALYADTTDPDALLDQMRLYTTSEQLDDLRRTADKIISSQFAGNMQKHNAASLLASGYARHNRAKELAQIMEGRLAEAPDDPNILRLLGQAYSHLDQRDKAIAMYERVTALEPDSRDAYYNLAHLYGTARRYPDEVRAYEWLIEQPIINLGNYSALARAYARVGRTNDILRLAGELSGQIGRRYGARRGDFQATLGEVYRAAAQYHDAIAAYRTAIELTPESQNRYHKQQLLEVYEQAGKTDLAEQLRATLPEPRRAAPSRKDLTGTKAPPFLLPDLSEQTVSLADHQGKVLLLNFWGSWCPPCVDEIPDLAALYETYKEQGLLVVGITIEFSRQTGMNGAATNVEGTRAFANKHSVTYPLVMADGKVQEAYGGIHAIPATFVVDRNGIIRKQYVGAQKRSVFEADLKPLLEAYPETPTGEGTRSAGPNCPVILRHRYGFAADATDAVGGASGTPRGDVVFRDGQAVLDGDGDFIELPASDIGINTYCGVTFEVWCAQPARGQGNTHLVSFGDTWANGFGRDYVNIVTTAKAKVSHGGMAITPDAIAPWEKHQGVDGPSLHDGQPHHYVLTVGSRDLAFYVDGVPQGTIELGPMSIGKLGVTCAYLGKSVWAGDNLLACSIDEFRIYQGVLSPELIAAHHQAGPDQSQLELEAEKVLDQGQANEAVGVPE